jgi:hypothetical protein
MHRVRPVSPAPQAVMASAMELRGKQKSPAAAGAFGDTGRLPTPLRPTVGTAGVRTCRQGGVRGTHTKDQKVKGVAGAAGVPLGDPSAAVATVNTVW